MIYLSICLSSTYLSIYLFKRREYSSLLIFKISESICRTIFTLILLSEKPQFHVKDMSLKDSLQILLDCLLLMPKKGRCEAPRVVEKILRCGWTGRAAVTETAPGYRVLLLLFYCFMFVSSDVCLVQKEDKDNWSDVTYHLIYTVAVLSVCYGPNRSLGSITNNFHWFW